jgi:DNA-directed RNA polymerase specialized sigma24 family protein
VDAVDAQLGALKERYREAFRAAFARATKELADFERTLLGLRFRDDRPLDEIASLYRSNRRTVSRWLAGIQKDLSERTRAHLETELAMTADEAAGVIKLINSKLPASMSGVFA